MMDIHSAIELALENLCGKYEISIDKLIVCLYRMLIYEDV